MLTRRTDNIANAVRLLVAMGGLATASGLKSALDVYEAIVANRPPKRLATLADFLTADARQLLQEYPDAPTDAALLYEQTVRASLLTPIEVVDALMDPATCVSAMLYKLRDTEHAKGGMPDLFTKITEPALRRFFLGDYLPCKLTCVWH